MTAFRACYADWKVIKTRSCVQLVFELPIEKADEAYQVLGGMPLPGKEIWCAVCRLQELVTPPIPQTQEAHELTGPRQAESPQPKPAGASRKSPAQIAGYLCTLPTFQKFLQEKFAEQWYGTFHPLYADEKIAAECIYDICTVTSRSQLTNENVEWHALQLAFRLWENHPELDEVHERT